MHVARVHLTLQNLCQPLLGVGLRLTLQKKGNATAACRSHIQRCDNDEAPSVPATRNTMMVLFIFYPAVSIASLKAFNWSVEVNYLKGLWQREQKS